MWILFYNCSLSWLLRCEIYHGTMTWWLDTGYWPLQAVSCMNVKEASEEWGRGQGRGRMLRGQNRGQGRKLWPRGHFGPEDRSLTEHGECGWLWRHSSSAGEVVLSYTHVSAVIIQLDVGKTQVARCRHFRRKQARSRRQLQQPAIFVPRDIRRRKWRRRSTAYRRRVTGNCDDIWRWRDEFVLQICKPNCTDYCLFIDKSWFIS